jgi:membrane protease YdiL (CAAX protease family)
MYAHHVGWLLSIVERYEMKSFIRRKGMGLSLLFLTCGLAIFFINMTFTGVIPLYLGISLKVGLVVIFSVTALFFYRNERLNPYWKIFFAFLTASVALFGSLYLSKGGLLLLNLSIDTLKGFTVYKLLEDLAIICLIVAFTYISRSDMASLYLKKGNLRYGLRIGLVSFFTLSIVSVLVARYQGISLLKFVALSPAILIIALGDGFMEELLFRGLFLKKLQPFLGFGVANTLTAIVYCLTHLQATFTPSLPLFLVVVFLLGLLWGYIIQRTDSLLASVLFHAGADVFIMIDFFQAYDVI